MRESGDDEWRDDLASEELKGRSVRGGMITAVVQVARVVLMLSSQILLARFLTPDDFGMVAMIAPVIGFVQVIADLGITQAVVSTPSLRLRQINSFFWANVVMALVLAAAAAAAAPAISWFYGEPRLVPIVLASAGLILISAIGLVQAALLNRQMRFGTIAMIDVTALLMSVVTGIVTAALGWGYWALIAAQAAFSVTTTTLVMLRAPWRPCRPGWDRGVMNLVRFGGAVTVANLVGYVNVSVDNVIIGAELGKISLGYYDRAWKLAVQPITQIQAPFNRVAIPALSRLVDDADAYRRVFLKMLQMLLAFSTPTMICAAVIAEPLIQIVLGARWSSIALPFSLMCFAGAVAPINSATFWLLISQGRVKEQVRLSIAAAVLNIAAYAIGVRYSLAALVALSLLSVYLLQVPLLLTVAVRKGPVRSKAISPLLIANVVAALTTVAALLILRGQIAGVALVLAAPILALLVNSATLMCFASARSYLISGLRLAFDTLRRAKPDQHLVSEAI